MNHTLSQRLCHPQSKADSIAIKADKLKARLNMIHFVFRVKGDSLLYLKKKKTCSCGQIKFDLDVLSRSYSYYFKEKKVHKIIEDKLIIK